MPTTVHVSVQQPFLCAIVGSQRLLGRGRWKLLALWLIACPHGAAATEPYPGLANLGPVGVFVAPFDRTAAQGGITTDWLTNTVELEIASFGFAIVPEHSSTTDVYVKLRVVKAMVSPGVSRDYGTMILLRVMREVYVLPTEEVTWASIWSDGVLGLSGPNELRDTLERSIQYLVRRMAIRVMQSDGS